MCCFGHPRGQIATEAPAEGAIGFFWKHILKAHTAGRFKEILWDFFFDKMLCITTFSPELVIFIKSIISPEFAEFLA